MTSDYVIPLSEQVRDLEREAAAQLDAAAHYRTSAARCDERYLALCVQIRDLKARIAAGGVRQEELFEGRKPTEGVGDET